MNESIDILGEVHRISIKNFRHLHMDLIKIISIHQYSSPEWAWLLKVRLITNTYFDFYRIWLATKRSNYAAICFCSSWKIFGKAFWQWGSYGTWKKIAASIEKSRIFQISWSDQWNPRFRQSIHRSRT